MEESLRRAYVEKFDLRGDVTVWIVDGAYVRRHMDAGFPSYGQHYRFPFIPVHEVWIDHQVTEGERQFIIDHLLLEHRLMAIGVPYEKALARADREEQKERRRAGVINVLSHHRQRQPGGQEAHERFCKKLVNGLGVWIVNGRIVRSIFDIEFIGGGHEFIYDFIPENEIWIDDAIPEADRGCILLHELHEWNRMSTGVAYNQAHSESSRLEYRCRHHPDELDAHLNREGWE